MKISCRVDIDFINSRVQFFVFYALLLYMGIIDLNMCESHYFIYHDTFLFDKTCNILSLDSKIFKHDQFWKVYTGIP